MAPSRGHARWTKVQQMYENVHPHPPSGTIVRTHFSGMREKCIWRLCLRNDSSLEGPVYR